jgi:hypothetical protein
MFVKTNTATLEIEKRFISPQIHTKLKDAYLPVDFFSEIP